MKKYGRLNKRDIKKLQFYNKVKKTSRKILKWEGILFAILLVFALGISAFYVIVDRDKNKTSETRAEKSVQSQMAVNEELDELQKKEFVRESARNSSIKISEDKNGGIEEKPYDFSEWNKICQKEMIVVNKYNPLPETYEVKTKLCRGKEVAVYAAADLETMISDARKAGIKLWISSGYRSKELQTKIFKKEVETENEKAVISQEEAEKRAQNMVSRPGQSEHHTGLAIDFNGVENSFYTTSEYKWLMDNAHKYGFIERYQKKWTNYTGIAYEPWHFRYVGKENAPLIKESGISLEEYLIQNFIKK